MIWKGSCYVLLEQRGGLLILIVSLKHCKPHLDRLECETLVAGCIFRKNEFKTDSY